MNDEKGRSRIVEEYGPTGVQMIGRLQGLATDRAACNTQRAAEQLGQCSVVQRKKSPCTHHG